MTSDVQKSCPRRTLISSLGSGRDEQLVTDTFTYAAGSRGKDKSLNDGQLSTHAV